MTTTTLGEGEESRTDDTEEGWGKWVILSEADFEDDACHACGLHIFGERKSRVEGMQFDDPLVHVTDQFWIDVPSQLMEWCLLLQFQNLLQIALERLRRAGSSIVWRLQHW